MKILIFNKIIFFFLSMLLFFSCIKNLNSEEIKIITELEKSCLIDQKNISSIKLNPLKKNIKISKFNLLALERKKLDSISIELIYFEYRDYLNCVNSMRLLIEKIDQLKHQLNSNIKQLQNLKKDYQDSKKRRNDLDTHLISEQFFIHETSQEIKKIINVNINIEEKFDSLNKEIELIIDEK